MARKIIVFVQPSTEIPAFLVRNVFIGDNAFNNAVQNLCGKRDRRGGNDIKMLSDGELKGVDLIKRNGIIC